MSSLLAPGASKALVRARVLTPVEAAALSHGLHADAADLYYSGWVSFVDALNGLSRGFYTWAAVKLYYSVFYTLNSSLAQSGVCAFHVATSQYTIDAATGETPVSCSERGTHKTVLNTFRRRNLKHPLMSQRIGLDEALEWLMHQREAANYREARFGEPECGPAFDFVARNGIRKALNAYIQESSFIYVFDPDHALLAFPLRTLQLIGNVVATQPTFTLSVEEKYFLQDRVRDVSGTIPAILSEMRRLSLVS
jgi:hypothetical protein